MAGVLVDVLLERLATLALDKVEKELKLVVGVKQEIKNLTKKLKAIRAVLEDAEQRQMMEASVKLWLDELTEVSFDMDDVLDEWITRVEKHQLEKQETEDGNVDVAAKKKVCFPFSSSCFRFGEVDYKLFLRHEIAKKIEELNDRLALIDQNKRSFNLQNITRAGPELPQRQKTTSLPNVKTFGRDNEKNLIVSKLLSVSSEGNEVPLIIPIVGMGGMGKTSLANLVYNDEKIKSHFDKSVWVCVSDPFEEIKIAKAIVEGLGINNASNELERLLKQINDSIDGKKFLLVLDDVWSPKLNQWEELIKPLRNGATGSRVLVTTRKEEVATLMEATTQMIPLKELGEPFCLSLFYYSAGVDESNVSKEILDIGLEIVKKCNGLPLVAKTLGGLMRNKKKIEEWQAILDSKTWELKEIEQHVFQPLLLSYYDLDPVVKRCLLYCVLFPKDYVYDKTNLIELWMSQDYLDVKGSKGNAIAGQNYFNDLVKRSFFQDIEVDVKSGNMTCKIHDIIHDFLQYLTKNEYLILVDGEVKEVPNDNVRHLNIASLMGSYSYFFGQQVSFNFKCSKLRTVLGRFTFAGHPGPILAQSKGLRVLDMSGESRVPKEIGGLVHLRYLDLSDYGQPSLPSAIGSLYNLQTLRLVGCNRLEELDVRKLINIMHLYVRGCDSLRLIKGIAKLRDLQRLDMFNVGRGEEGNKLEDLKDLMNQLQGSLAVDFCRSAENAGILVNMRHLVQLKLSFWRCNDKTQETLQNGLEPHRALECLEISEYRGRAFSHWLSSLPCLRVLRLTTCSKCESFPPLGKLASLEFLEIDILAGVSKVGVEFLGIEQGQTSSSSLFTSFPKLKKLMFFRMESWEEWEGVEEENSENNITIMPCLSHLQIYSCKKLKALPEFLWKTPLQKLGISRSSIIQSLYRQGKGEEWAKISHIPSIKLEDW